MSQPQRNPRPEVAADVPTYLSDLNAAQRDLVELVLRMSRRFGYCYASGEFLAGELSCSRRHVRRLVAELREAGILAVTHRRAKTSLIRVKPQAVDKLARTAQKWEDIYVLPPGQECPPRGGQECPPKGIKNLNIGGQPDSPGQATLPFGGERVYFDPRRPFNALDHFSPAQRLRYAFKDKRFQFAQHAGRTRTVCDVEWYGQEAVLSAIVEDDPKRPPERLVVHAEQIGEWLFWW